MPKIKMGNLVAPLKKMESTQFSLDSTILNQYLQYTDVNECIIEKCGCVFDEATLNDSWTPEQVNYCIFDVDTNPFDTPYSTIDASLGYLWDEINISKLPERVLVLGNGSHFFSAPTTEAQLDLQYSQDCNSFWYDAYLAAGYKLVDNRTIYEGYVSPLCLRERLVKNPELKYYDAPHSEDDPEDVLGQISAQSTCRKLCEASVPLALEADLEAAGVLTVKSGKCTSITYEECNSLRTQFANTEDVSNVSSSDTHNGCLLEAWSNKLGYNTATTTECSEDNPCLCSDCQAGHYIRGGKCVACDTCGNGQFIKHGTCSGRRNSVCLDCPTDVPWASTPQTVIWAPSVIPYYRMSNFNDENSCVYWCPDGMLNGRYGPLQEANGYMEGPMRCLPACTEGAIDCASLGFFCALYLNGTCVSECPLIVNGKCVQKTKEWLEDEYKLLNVC